MDVSIGTGLHTLHSDRLLLSGLSPAVAEEFP